jgi:hypothetical protein
VVSVTRRILVQSHRSPRKWLSPHIFHYISIDQNWESSTVLSTDFMCIPQGPIKDQIIECGNRVMAPSTLSPESDPDPKPPERPIMKVFAYLRQSLSLFSKTKSSAFVLRENPIIISLLILPSKFKSNPGDLCLNYQLEALHYQASQLGRSAWATHTRLLISTDRKNLTIMYWL